MKKINILLPALALTLSASGALASDDYATKYKGYRLDFQDEFNTGDRPDENVWKFETGYQRNNEAQYYQKDNASIKDGLLVIEGRREKKGGMSYTSASMITRDDKGYNWQYGIYEIRAKLPCYTGCWPAIWTTGSAYEWPYNGEIDIMEYYPSGGAEAIHANVAWGSSTRWTPKWNSKIKKLNTYPNMEEWKRQFHTWTMIYTEKYIKLYCDNDLINQVDLDGTVNPRCSWFPHDGNNPYRDPENRQHVWLNLALGGNNGGSLSNTPFPCHYYVDYVRVYVPDGSEEPSVTHPIVDDPSEEKLPEVDVDPKDPETKVSHNYATPYNLMADGDFELDAPKDYPYEWVEDFSVVDGNTFGAWKKNDGCDVWNVAVCLREQEPDGEYIFEGNKQFLRMQRYQKNGWAEAAISQHVSGLTKGETYVLDAITAYSCVRSQSSDRSRGIRVFSADSKGTVLNPVFTDKSVGYDENWSEWEMKFKAPAADIVVEIFINNPWVGADGGDYNTDVWIDVDKMRLYKDEDYEAFHKVIDSSSVDAVSVDEDAPAEYYTLQGVKVANPGSGFYICRRGSKVTKILR